MTGTLEEAFEQGRQMAKEAGGKWGKIKTKNILNKY